jgi:FkbM family methyltransferase
MIGKIYIKRIVNRVLQLVLPSKIYLSLLIWKRGYEEPELKLVYDLCDKSLISIDIGAANGLYLAHLYKISRRCYAFEPRKEAVKNLENVFSGITTAIQFENVALSSFSGFSELKVPKNYERLSSLETENLIEGFDKIELIKVPVKRLDDYKFDGKVGFIKIDVEGHEKSVLDGAVNLLERDHPSMLIEIEERHKPNSINDIKSVLNQLGYKGFFYCDDHLRNIELFDIKKYQNYGVASHKYIFNFIFVHQDSVSRIGHLLI